MAAISGTTLAVAAGVGAAAGAAKYGVAKNKEKRDRKLAAATQRLSPWTGLQAQPIHEPNLAGDLIGGATTGAMMGASLGTSGAAGAAAAPAAATSATAAGMASAPALTSSLQNAASVGPSVAPWAGGAGYGSGMFGASAPAMAFKPQGLMDEQNPWARLYAAGK